MRGRLLPGARRGADRALAEDVHDVARVREPVRGGDVLRPPLDGVGLDLDGPAAVPADEVVVVPVRRARTVERLAVLLQRVGISLGRQVGERPVDRRQSDGGPPSRRCWWSACALTNPSVPDSALRTASRCQVFRFGFCTAFMR